MLDLREVSSFDHSKFTGICQRLIARIELLRAREETCSFGLEAFQLS